jgi:hypothetical protein
MTMPQTVPSKPDYSRPRRARAWLEFRFDSEQEPELSLQTIRRLQRRIGPALNRGGEVVFAQACTNTSCANDVGTVKDLVKQIAGISVTCSQKCVWVKTGGKWQKVCSFDCHGGSLTLSGYITEE